MKFLIVSLLLIATTSCFGGKSAINLHGGSRSLSNDVETVDSQPLGGLELVVGAGDSGTAIEGSIWYADDSGGQVNGFTPSVTTKELALGVRHTFLEGLPVKIYIGGGANYIDGELSDFGADNETDTGFGGYAHAGATFALLFMNLGLDVRGGLTSAELAGESLDYVQATIFIGLTF